MRSLLLTLMVGVSLSQQPFQSLEGVIGYIVIEKGGRIENYIVVEGKDGTVKTVRVDKKPSEFLKKTEEGGKK